MPPSAPPFALTLSLAATLLLGGWFAAAAVHGLRMDGPFQIVARERLAERARPVWPELVDAYALGNPPSELKVPSGDPRPTLAAMLDRPYVRAAFHVAPDLLLTYQARAGAPVSVDLRTWRPAMFNLGWQVAGPPTEGDRARFAFEAAVVALVHENALMTHARAGEFRRVPSDAGRRLHARGTREWGWIGYDTSVCGPASEMILARHGLDDLLVLSTDRRRGGHPDWPTHPEVIKQALLPPSGTRLPSAIADLQLVPRDERFFGFHMEVLFEVLRNLSLLLVATGVSLIVSLRQLRALMRHRALAEARGRFVSGMSHEMRTPLTTIKLYAEMLQHGVVADTEARRGYLGTIARECDRLTRLVENVLAYAAFESRARPLVIDPIDARALLEEAVAAAKGPLEQAGLEVKVHAPVPLRLAADRDALVLAIANLLTNAAKYAADGRVVLLSALPAPDRSDEAVLAVRDFGPGIPVAERGRVFQPFYRRAHERAPGTGLGLALVEETARRHGGRVEIGGEPGEGAELRLRLPLAEPEAEGVPA